MSIEIVLIVIIAGVGFVALMMWLGGDYPASPRSSKMNRTPHPFTITDQNGIEHKFENVLVRKFYPRPFTGVQIWVERGDETITFEYPVSYSGQIDQVIAPWNS